MHAMLCVMYTRNGIPCTKASTMASVLYAAIYRKIPCVSKWVNELHS